MRKQNILTLIGVALSFLIAIGGWWMTGELLDRKESALLSATGSVHVNMTGTSSIAENDGGTMAYHLSASEMFRVLRNWEMDGYELPHEPVEGQLNMEQAMDAGKAGLSYFYEQGIIPAELLEYDKTNAYLYENQLSEQKRQSLAPYYSYWIVSFFSENGNATLTINAVTGQIWKAEMDYPLVSVSANVMGAGKLLDVFTSYLDLNDISSTKVIQNAYTNTAYQSFADDRFYGVAGIRSGTTTAESGGEFIWIYMRLSTQE